MKFVLFESAGAAEPRPGLLTDRGVIDLSGLVPRGHTPQLTMQALIDGFDALRPELARLGGSATAVPLEQVRLRAPLPRPGKILCCIANY